MPLVSTNGTYGIIDCNTSTSRLVPADMGFAMIVTALSPGLAKMLLEIGVNAVELGVDFVGRISDDSSKLFIIQQLIAIEC